MQIRSQLQVSTRHEYKKINNKTLATEQLRMAPASTRKIASNWKQYLLFIVFPLILSGCTQKSFTETLNATPEPAVVQQKTIDFRWAECNTLNSLYKEGINNALYWLRTIECTHRIMSTEAQRQASQVIVTSWDNAFYKSILLERAGMSIAERRTQLVLLESYKLQFPSSMRILLSTWIENQTLTLALAEEKTRYRRFSTETENRVELLRKENNALEHELKVTLKKLENLTQIERQLSSRKQGASVDSLSQDELLSESTSTTIEIEKNIAEKSTVEKPATQTMTTQSITVKPKSEETQSTPTSIKNEPVKPEPAKPEQAEPEPIKPGSVTPDTEKQEPIKPTEAESK